MGNIYIMHQYYEKSHFKALYEAEEKNGYNVKRFIILDNKTFVRKVFGAILKKKNPKEALKIAKDRFLGLHELRTTKNQNLIVGLAPYDQLLFKYSKIIRNHHSVYFTSSTIWDSPPLFERGSFENKEHFIDILKNDFKAVACVSKETQSQIDKYFDKSQVVGHSVDVKKYKKKKNKNKKINFLFIGQINKRKNIPLITEWIKDNSNEFRFDFIGSMTKDDSSVYRKLLELEAHDNRVNYLGIYTKKQIMAEIGNYDFLVLPSLEEKFGIVLIEALSANVPCIVSNTFGPSEIIEDGKNGIIFDVNNSRDFSIKMTEAFEMSDDSYSMMMTNAGNRANDFDVNTVFEKWTKLLK
ncbi:hypothetical protein G15_0616 [Enterococcus avium]|nr:hypothetical protein G15_0616 [Enterococcus avium]